MNKQFHVGKNISVNQEILLHIRKMKLLNFRIKLINSHSLVLSFDHHMHLLTKTHIWLLTTTETQVPNF